MAPLVRTVGLTRIYRRGRLEVHALRGVDLTLERGVLTAVRGRSGSGKTTLLNLIGGLDRPTAGEVYLEGEPLSRLSEGALTKLRRRCIGFVFQSFALLPTFSAYENVELPLRLLGVDRRERARRVRDALALVGLEPWADHRPYELSGGQQQRLAIARALVTRPRLILADEPTGELDSEAGREVLALLRRIAEEEGVGVLIATHDPAIEEYAAVIHELRDGQLAGPYR